MGGWQYLFDRAEFVCPCGVGHYAHWAATRVHGCCPNGCCGRAFGDVELGPFPGTDRLNVGDIALCGAGFVGLLASGSKQLVTYPDGNTAEAWVGIHVFGGAIQKPDGAVLAAEPGSPWSSRNPAKIGHINELVNGPWKIRDLVKARAIEGWKAALV